MSLTSIAIILIAALILFGPEDLPVFARVLGKVVYNVRKYANEITKEFQDVIDTPSNIANDVLKGSGKESKGRSSSDSKSEPEDKGDDGEEFLTYDEEEKVTDDKAAENEDNNPLAALPADIVTKPKDKQAGE